MLTEYYEIIRMAKEEPDTLGGIVARISIYETAAGYKGHNNPDVFELSLEKLFNSHVEEFESIKWDMKQVMASLVLAKRCYYGEDPKIKQMELENHFCPDRLATLQTHPELEGII